MRLLLVENSKTMASMILNELMRFEGIEVDWADKMQDALAFIEKNGAENYSLAISCLNLEDAPDGEMIPAITEYQIPIIIFTAKFDDITRDELVQMPGVVDYVVKESQSTLRYLSNMVHRLIANRKIKALVVDDSRTMRMHTSGLLRQYQFQVLEAMDGQEALKILEKNRDVKLVVTDYNMPNMDGFELTKAIRETYAKEELVVIGLSGLDVGSLSARFIKVGANDFITKPFLPEEFFCRITQNIDLIEKTKALVDMATKDFLTGLYNRRFFFEKGVGKLNKLYRDRKPCALAMLDIDHFKSVNDTFGHDVGDEVLKVVSHLLVEYARPDDLVARLGGEEFCILLGDISRSELEVLFERMRAAIEDRHFDSLEDRKFVTTSFGVVIAEGEDLDSLVKAADELLYEAKQTGRNKVSFKD